VGERQGLEIRRPAAAAGGSAQNAAKRGQPTPLSLSLYSYSPLSSAAVRAPPVANFALALQKQEAVQRQDGPDHVFSHPLGLELGPDMDPAVKARLEGLEPPTRCLGGSWTTSLIDVG